MTDGLLFSDASTTKNSKFVPFLLINLHIQLHTSSILILVPQYAVRLVLFIFKFFSLIFKALSVFNVMSHNLWHYNVHPYQVLLLYCKYYLLHLQVLFTIFSNKSLSFVLF